MRPTRIIEKPWFKQVGRSKYKQCRCDDGNIYTVQDLAEIFEVTPQWMSCAIRLRGWENPRVFEFDCRVQTRPRKLLKEYVQESPYKVVASGDLAHLSSTHNRYGEYVGASR